MINGKCSVAIKKGVATERMCEGGRAERREGARGEDGKGGQTGYRVTALFHFFKYGVEFFVLS